MAEHGAPSTLWHQHPVLVWCGAKVCLVLKVLAPDGPVLSTFSTGLKVKNCQKKHKSMAIMIRKHVKRTNKVT